MHRKRGREIPVLPVPRRRQRETRSLVASQKHLRKHDPYPHPSYKLPPALHNPRLFINQFKNPVDAARNPLVLFLFVFIAKYIHFPPFSFSLFPKTAENHLPLSPV